VFRSRRLVVFGASSLALVEPKTLIQADLRSPVKRDDLALLVGTPTGTVLILDGVFGSSLAVTPSECRRLIEAGWMVVGASSMGALRASELWSCGMIGLGTIYNYLRVGQIQRDSDVAVVLDPRTFREITLSIVHISSALATAEKAGLITAAKARVLLLAARMIYWAERDWAECKSRFARANIAEDVIRFIEQELVDPGSNPKVRDGLLAVRTVLARRWTEART